MNISRISKAVAEMRRAEHFQEAEDVRNCDVDLILPGRLSATDRMIAQTVVALALRCFNGKIRVHTPALDAECVELMQRETAKVGPPQRLDIDPKQLGDWQIAVAACHPSAVSLDASGWVSRINGKFAERTPAAAPAITFGSACAVAKLFNRAVLGKTSRADEQWDFSLLQFKTGSEDSQRASQNTDLGRIGLLGAGAIGSAVGYVLSLTRWRGILEIIDPEVFEGPNLETCILANVTDVNRPMSKALSLGSVFTGHPISAKPHQVRVEEGDNLLKEKWGTFICAVDNSPTRRILDDVTTDLLLNAGLGDSREDAGWVFWTRHTQTDPKLSSFYPAQKDAGPDTPVPSEFREKCSRMAYQGVSLALPFVALAAGSLLAASLYQRAQNRLAEVGLLQMDLLGKQQKFRWD